MSRRNDERGSSLVEFTLVVPVFLLVVIGAASLVWLIGSRSTVSGAARDGARFASIAVDPAKCGGTSPCYPDEATVRAFVRERAGDEDLDVQLTPAVYRNQEVVVKVTGQLESVFSSFGELVGLDDLTFSSTARARTE